MRGEEEFLLLSRVDFKPFCRPREKGKRRRKGEVEGFGPLDWYSENRSS